MNTVVKVRTPCRLHFGMFGFGDAEQFHYGGAGAMIEPPCVEVTLRPALRFSVLGDLTERTRRYVDQLVTEWNLASLPRCEIVVQSPREHTGLGVGTQLALAVAAGLRRFLKLPEVSIEILAGAVGRGARSAVGSHGFAAGGLILHGGKLPSNDLGIVAGRIALPEIWRFVLFRRRGEDGLSGINETTAFSRLQPASEDMKNTLLSIATREMFPAADSGDYRRFGEAVYQFGRLAGEYFSPIQGGPFASAEIARLIESIREFGVPGAGQSSWGPTVFAITAGDMQADKLIECIRGQHYVEEYEISVARANNSGARIEEIAETLPGGARRA